MLALVTVVLAPTACSNSQPRCSQRSARAARLRTLRGAMTATRASVGVAPGPIYLDYNATTPLHADVKEVMVEALELFGNPSSGHAYGAGAKAAIVLAREQVAALTGAKPDEVVFTSGGTESNNWAIIGGAREQRSAGRGAHIITSAVEHPAVTEVCKYLEEFEGFEVSYIPVDEEGIIKIDAFKEALRSDTILVSVMHANNEVGAVQPITELAKLARAANPNILVHTDASQSVGKIPANIHELDVDLLTIAGHKLYAPKGVGALIKKEGVSLQKFMHGAGHERGLRAGTENTVHIAALGKACDLAAASLIERVEHCSKMREHLCGNLTSQLEAQGIAFRVNGPADAAKRLPNTLSISLKGEMGSEVVSGLAPHVAFSAGSACHHGQVTVSGVLAAMHVPEEYALGTLRLSVGKDTTEEDLDTAVNLLVNSVTTAKVR